MKTASDLWSTLEKNIGEMESNMAGLIQNAQTRWKGNYLNSTKELLDITKNGMYDHLAALTKILQTEMQKIEAMVARARQETATKISLLVLAGALIGGAAGTFFVMTASAGELLNMVEQRLALPMAVQAGHRYIRIDRRQKALADPDPSFEWGVIAE